MTLLNLRATTALFPLLLLAAIAATPVAAQNSQQPVIITPPMQDFSLPPTGQTPTPRPTAAPTPAPTPVPIRPVPVPQVSPTATRTPAPRSVATSAAPVPQPSAPVPETSPGPVDMPMTPVTPATPIQSDLTSDIAANPETASEMPGWLLPVLGGALLLVAGLTAGWWFGRRRRREDEEAEEAPVFTPPASAPSPGPPPLDRRAPSAQPAAPRAAPSAPPPEGPLLTEMRPLRAAIRDGIVTVDFELFIQNRGTEAADNIRATLALLGANAEQDQQIAAFHAAARMAAGAEPFSLAPGGVYMLSGQVSLPGDQMAVVNVQGKPMFVPILPVALRWYAGLSIRTLRDVFMVGTAPAQGSDKLGPLWVERAGEGFGRLAAKRYVPKVAG
ncbi:hypothetical protein [Sphingomonas sp. LT1P40]|uniref:hypothetical protein n=1 Tax=Alteristakelama amylovorans TaxID=3096166 RepID=UPI002FCB07F3